MITSGTSFYHGYPDAISLRSQLSSEIEGQRDELLRNVLQRSDQQEIYDRATLIMYLQHAHHILGIEETKNITFHAAAWNNKEIGGKRIELIIIPLWCGGYVYHKWDGSVGSWKYFSEFPKLPTSGEIRDSVCVVA